MRKKNQEVYVHVLLLFVVVRLSENISNMKKGNNEEY